MNEGDRVITPDGPGTIVSFWHSWEGMRRRVEVGVLLDDGQQWRKLYRPQELEPEQYETVGEHHAEQLAMERWKEAKHRE